MYFFDQLGHPLDIDEYITLHRDQGYCRIGLDQVGDVRISTVWIGIDMSMGESEQPVTFETMSFGEGSEWDHEVLGRYCTSDAAILGHAMACEIIAESAVEVLRTEGPETFGLKDPETPE